MKRLIAVLLISGLAMADAGAQCQFSNGNIINTTDPSCAGRMLTYTESTSGVELIALGYPVPVPVSSLTPVTDSGLTTVCSPCIRTWR